jgi:Homing endonuclease associated repeat
MPSTEFHDVEITIEPAQAATLPSPETMPLPELPEVKIKSEPEPTGSEQTVAQEEHITKAQEPEMQQTGNAEGSSRQAHPAENGQRARESAECGILEIAPARAGVGDLRRLGGAGKHSLARKQALEEERRTVIAAIQECAKKLGKAPSFDRMRGMTGITMHRIQRHFGGYNGALGACGLELHDNGRTRTMQELFEDWIEVVRKVGKAPTRAQYDLHGRNSSRPLLQRFHTWSAIPAGMKHYAMKHGLEAAWNDVIGTREVPMESRGVGSRIGPIVVSEPPLEIPKRSSFGDPLTDLPMVHAPTCENAVLFLFGAMANDLGFKVRRMQPAFPDCLAVRRVGENRWEDVKVELELFSRNFALHGHDPKGCDLIVCWEHNWPECPLEVLELKKKLP